MSRIPSEARQDRTIRRAALATLVGLAGFVGFWAGAMALYPGGTFREPKHKGQSFFGNFFCDLAQPVSLSGVANPVGSRLAQCGMLSFAIALWAAFWIASSLVAPGGARSWLRRLASLSVLTFVVVSLAPSELFGSMHAVLALFAGAFGIAAMLLAVRGLSRAKGSARVLAGLGALALAVGAFDSVIFVHHLGDVAPPPSLVPAVQKVAAILLGLWMAGVALVAILDKERARA